MSIWQTESWQNMLVSSGQSEEYFVLEMNYNTNQNTKVFVEKRRVSLGEYGLFIQGFQGEIHERLENNLISLCVEENCLFAQIEMIDYDIKLNNSGDNELEYFKTGYYKKFIPPYTAIIDLTKTEDEILAGMKPKGRYNIRLAEKKGVVVEQVEKNLYNIKKFFHLMRETTARDNFSGNNLEYYEKLLKNIESSQIFFAYFESKVIAAGIFVGEGDTALYYYGASGNEHRNLMAPYLLQWSAISQAKKRGCKIYDFLGVAGPDEVNSPLAGVTEFKMKLAPNKIFVSDSFLYINKKGKYQAIILLRKFRKILFSV